jgi:hypothetical protein
MAFMWRIPFSRIWKIEFEVNRGTQESLPRRDAGIDMAWEREKEIAATATVPNWT